MGKEVKTAMAENKEVETFAFQAEVSPAACLALDASVSFWFAVWSRAHMLGPRC